MAHYRVVAPHFVAVITTSDARGGAMAEGKITDAAPILKWAKGWLMWRFRNYCQRPDKRWKIERLFIEEVGRDG